MVMMNLSLPIHLLVFTTSFFIAYKRERIDVFLNILSLMIKCEDHRIMNQKEMRYNAQV